MKLFATVAAAVLAGALLLAPLPTRAQGPEGTLVIGSTQVLKLRNGDTLNGREWSVQDRINHIQDLLPKYLGGPYYKITSKRYGNRVHLYFNGDFVLAVTPADARATGYKTAARLAPVWADALAKGFEAAHVHVIQK
jgi:hypothetical protein